jgi:hypothetical protein
MTLEKKRVNDTFNIGAEEFKTMKEDYQAVLDAAGYGKKIVLFPAAPVILVLRFLEALKLSPLYKGVYETASKDSFVCIEKAEKVLGYKPKFSNQDALVRNFKWYLNSTPTFHFSGQLDRARQLRNPNIYHASCLDSSSLCIKIAICRSSINNTINSDINELEIRKSEMSEEFQKLFGDKYAVRKEADGKISINRKS